MSIFTLPSGFEKRLQEIPPFPKRRIFVSYHHGRDRNYYDFFSRKFSEEYEVIHDNSVRREINSDNAEYVIRAIRERFINGSSCTIVLCGRDTPYRRFVDWEIKATLDDEDGLVAVILPDVRQGTNGYAVFPERLQDNIFSRYAPWISWDALIQSGAARLVSLIQYAISTKKSLIDNSREMMKNSRPPPAPRIVL
jgi:hypothetical protein